MTKNEDQDDEIRVCEFILTAELVTDDDSVHIVSSAQRAELDPRSFLFSLGFKKCAELSSRGQQQSDLCVCVCVCFRAAGCIFGELLNSSPLFPGENDIEQLCCVLRVLGTPTRDSWPVRHTHTHTHTHSLYVCECTSEALNQTLTRSPL